MLASIAMHTSHVVGLLLAGLGLAALLLSGLLLGTAITQV